MSWFGFILYNAQNRANRLQIELKMGRTTENNVWNKHCGPWPTSVERIYYITKVKYTGTCWFSFFSPHPTLSRWIFIMSFLSFNVFLDLQVPENISPLPPTSLATCKFNFTTAPSVPDVQKHVLPMPLACHLLRIPVWHASRVKHVFEDHSRTVHLIPQDGPLVLKWVNTLHEREHNYETPPLIFLSGTYFIFRVLNVYLNKMNVERLLSVLSCS